MSAELVIDLLHEAAYGTLATHSTSAPGYPYATVVPYVTDAAHRPVLCLSALAEHTRNLLADPRASLSVLQPGAADVQTASRLTLLGEAERIEPDGGLRARYLRYAPNTEALLSLDFHFYRLNPRRVRYIAGFGRMGWVEQAELDALPGLDAGVEADLLATLATQVPDGVCVLGLDACGIDLAVGGQRVRERFAERPLQPEAIAGAARDILARPH